MPRVLRHFLLLALLAISASLIATEPIVRPKVLATAKPSGRVVRQILVANRNSPRVLLIGDSILEGYHAKAAELLRGKVNSRRLGHLEAHRLRGPARRHKGHLRQTFLRRNPVQRHWPARLGARADSQGPIRSAAGSPGQPRKFAAEAKLIFASTTPMTTETRPIALDPEFNPVIVERNKIAGKIMAENHVPVTDYYGILAAKPHLPQATAFTGQSRPTNCSPSLPPPRSQRLSAARYDGQVPLDAKGHGPQPRDLLETCGPVQSAAIRPGKMASSGQGRRIRLCRSRHKTPQWHALWPSKFRDFGMEPVPPHCFPGEDTSCLLAARTSLIRQAA